MGCEMKRRRRSVESAQEVTSTRPPTESRWKVGLERAHTISHYFTHTCCRQLMCSATSKQSTTRCGLHEPAPKGAVSSRCPTRPSVSSFTFATPSTPSAFSARARSARTSAAAGIGRGTHPARARSLRELRRGRFMRQHGAQMRREHVEDDLCCVSRRTEPFAGTDVEHCGVHSGERRDPVDNADVDFIRERGWDRPRPSCCNLLPAHLSRELRRRSSRTGETRRTSNECGRRRVGSL